MEPAIIRKLDETVVNRIAAGEIIQRSSNALKELIENSIDAKSTNISITVKAGGLKYLNIQDNGTGIRKDDLAIVCERFTTSKLQTFDDLSTIHTYGFRGEALASISHIAHLTIVTKTTNEKCAYQAKYVDGKLTDKPKPCAANQGTQIIVEDLFYNMSTRKNAFKNPNEEYLRIYDVVCKYAIHNSRIGFALKKFGERNDLKTPINSTHIDNIRIVYGNEIAKELLEIEFDDQNYKFKCRAFVTNVNYSTKRAIFLLFINHRLVESSNLRKTLDSVYGAYLPKGSSPFLYISLEIDPRNCDVNVHPTKHEVHFLHEENIIERIKTEIENRLLGSNVSRTMYIQTRLPGATDIKSVDDVPGAQRTYDKNLVRTDAKEQKLEKFFGETSKNSASSTKVPVRKFELMQRQKDKERIDVRLASVLRLRKTILDSCNSDLRDLFSQHKFVGNINPRQTLIQYSTKLFLCNTKKLSQELFYQFLMFDFQNFDQIKFKTPLSIHELVLIALEHKNIEYDPEVDGSKNEIAQSVQKILTNKSEMLRAYFALDINSDGQLVTIPLLLPNYLPDMSRLPVYILKLATEVDWDTEQECFETFARQTAIFYSNIANTDEMTDSDVQGWSWTIEHVLYPALKRYFIPDSTFTKNGCLIQVANLPDLYKVFERC